MGYCLKKRHQRVSALRKIHRIAQRFQHQVLLGARILQYLLQHQPHRIFKVGTPCERLDDDEYYDDDDYDDDDDYMPGKNLINCADYTTEAENISQK